MIFRPSHRRRDHPSFIIEDFILSFRGIIRTSLRRDLSSSPSAKGSSHRQRDLSSILLEGSFILPFSRRIFHPSLQRDHSYIALEGSFVLYYGRRILHLSFQRDLLFIPLEGYFIAPFGGRIFRSFLWMYHSSFPSKGCFIIPH
ncbi:uncharacterized protein G2W53_010751 [Senna tora]|uniref:Uncharacterized protein n=1 Tax=Senna tora TaxID=362788 RepID=A0A835CEF0_9FABA|nr:uncharacterized protein G2W53_010751 [Senna tora]